MLQRLRSRRARTGIDGEALRDELAGGVGDVRPVLLRLELEVAGDDGLHLLVLGVTVERGVPCAGESAVSGHGGWRCRESEHRPVKPTSEQEVRDHTHRPDVHGFAVSGCMSSNRAQ